MEKINGLSAVDVEQRLQRDGFNELPSQKKHGAIEIFIDVVKEPMLFLLIAAGTIYFFLGEVQDAVMLMVFVFVVVGITFYQERKTERALEALRDLSSPRALVIRDGVQKMIAGREVVCDDVVVLREGMRVPADAVVLSAASLSIDESLLTGESMSVRKSEWDGHMQKAQPGGDDLPFVFSGTLVTQGHAVVRVTEVGSVTEIGKIGVSLGAIEEEEMLLKKETRILVRNFAIAGIVLCGVVLAVYGFAYHDWVQGVLSGLSLSMAMLPEEFSVVLAVFLAIGSWRMSRNRVLTRHTAAIETLGAATVLCVDKTGTITENRMQLSYIMANDVLVDIDDDHVVMPEQHQELLQFALLASQQDPFDPIEKAIRSKITVLKNVDDVMYTQWKMLREFPLSKELMALSHVWMSPDDRICIAAAKGAPEAIADLCHFDHVQKENLMKHVAMMSEKGLRILGVAQAIVPCPDDAVTQHDYAYQFLGLIGFIDPVRSAVPRAVEECYRAGIKVIMITGDYPGTAQFVGRSIGLKNVDRFMTGAELSSCDQGQLQKRIIGVSIFSRVVPEQKLAIVSALKTNGEIVVMTGDGVNDAPALKSAHVGVAMGARGTDVAREASDIVLLDDNFSSIVVAVKMGRRVFDNLKKAIAYIFSVHIPIAGLSLIPVFFHWPVMLFPAHIAFLELIIDPACSIVYESEKAEKGIMTRPPRSLKESLLDRRSFITSVLQGMSILSMVLVMYGMSLYWNFGEEKMRALTFVTLVFGNVMLIITNLSHCDNLVKIVREGNKALWIVMCIAIAGLLILIYVPFFRQLFHFEVLRVGEFLLGCTAAVIGVLWFEIYKMITYGTSCKGAK